MKSVKGRRYWYRQSSNGNGQRQEYVGPETPELLDRIERAKRMAETARSRRDLVRALTRYAWHKCILAERRTLPAKVRKDLSQAEILFDVLVSERPGDVADMFADLAGPGRSRWQQIALDGLAKIGPTVRNRVRALV